MELRLVLTLVSDFGVGGLESLESWIPFAFMSLSVMLLHESGGMEIRLYNTRYTFITV